MTQTAKKEMTREDLFLIFGNLSEEQKEEKIEEARKIAEDYGIGYESIIDKTVRISNGEVLGGSIYVNKRIEEFARIL